MTMQANVKKCFFFVLAYLSLEKREKAGDLQHRGQRLAKKWGTWKMWYAANTKADNTSSGRMKMFQTSEKL